MNKPLLQQISDMILTIPGELWDFDHVMCGSVGCAIGHAINRGILPQSCKIEPIIKFGQNDHTFGFDEIFVCEELDISNKELNHLFIFYPSKIKPTREFVHNRLQWFIDHDGEINNNVPN